ncbi:glycosyltransferase family 2 protein [Planctomycetales bacterium ZRK34]|nr:glycosyltransferase family 2 protein [Planctomycetales bacterium ZRK34]
MKVRVIIVNYRIADMVIECLKSLAPEVAAMGNVHVDLVDNASGDDSVAKFQQAAQAHGWEDWLTIWPLQKNLGFAGGNNHPIREDYRSQAPADYYLLLNPDTCIRPGAIKTLTQFMQDHPNVGIAGSRLLNADGTTQQSSFRFNTWISDMCLGFRIGLIDRLCAKHIVARGIRDDEHETDWVSGASMMIKREVIDDIGLMDEGYFLYFEEMDYCLQARRAGWPCWFVPDSCVVHYVGQSTGQTSATRQFCKRRSAYWFEARSHYFLKNFGRTRKFLADVLWTIGYATYRMRIRLMRKPDYMPPYLLRDFIRHNFLGKRGC